MAEKYIMLSLDDERTQAVAEVLNNKTCKKILTFLAEREASETDISKALNIPANTVNYDIKKLVDSGLIEKTGFFWSVKGKKMPSYKASKKMILISPKKSNVKKVFGAFLLTGITSFFIKMYTQSLSVSRQTFEQGSEKIIASGGDMATSVVSPMINETIQFPQLWLWFLLGGLTALLFYLILNWRKL